MVGNSAGFLQHSNTPSLHHSRAGTFENCWQPYEHLFIGHSSEFKEKPYDTHRPRSYCRTI